MKGFNNENLRKSFREVDKWDPVIGLESGKVSKSYSHQPLKISERSISEILK